MLDKKLFFNLPIIILLTLHFRQGKKNKEQDRTTMVLRQALEVFYFWVNFAPLTRGTAACGYAALLSVMLSKGWMFAEGLSLTLETLIY